MTGRKEMRNMAGIARRTIVFFAAFVVAVLLASCYEPSPLYGKWTDNNGNSISFISDGTFVAKINDKTDTLITYQGDYSVIENVLVFNISSPSASTIDTEWDIRGSLLFCTWTQGGVTRTLTLYHVSK
ncbi:MAG: hypothetical protein HDR32_04770 [Treponema sp.]|nr:hypothetical protein [Treponema sp.]